MAMASLSIHHLRNVLTLRARSDQGAGTSYMISSARPGDGKTSLSLALAMSFASEGNRTVMVDSDLVGRGLSRSLELDQVPGLTDLLDRLSLDGCVHPTHVTNMWAVPAGLEGGRNPEELSVDEFRRMVELLKSQFDTVIVDTGPLMGSLEANLGAAIVDYTILTVSRGQDPRVVKAAIRRLEQIGGRCAGLVFNKASHRDLTSNVSQVSFHSHSVRTDNGEPKRRIAPESTSPGFSQGDRKALVRALMEQTSESPKETTSDWALAE
jgi:capsular exopolysaccharide synthesis family protein